MWENRKKIFTFNHSNASFQCFIFFVSGQQIEVLWKKFKTQLLGIDTDQDRPDLDQHALDADTDPAK
jgi:hypothetical protein